MPNGIASQFSRTDDALTSFDHVASTAISSLDFSGSFADFRNSPTARPNTDLTIPTFAEGIFVPAGAVTSNACAK